MTALLPNNYAIVTAQGSQWSVIITVYNDDGSLTNIVGKTFEFVVRDRTDAAGKVLFSVNNTSSTSSGTITVTTSTSSLQVVVTPAATNLLTAGGGPYTLWMDQGLSDATALLTGTFLASVVAAA